MLNILIAEDNAGLRSLMKLHFQREGYNVLEAANGAEALRIIESIAVHVLVADIMMPEMDGYQLVRELRSAKYNLPIIFVTAKDSIDDKKTGFLHGADDYIVKPFEMEELVLRVRALLRRANMNVENVMKIGSCVLDESRLSVTRGEDTIVLRPKEFALLFKLLSYPGRIFTRNMLMDELWGYTSNTDPRTVDVHIKRLREHLKNIDEFEIQTVRGLGYRAVILK